MRPTAGAVVLLGSTLPATLVIVLVDSNLWPVAMATSFLCLVLIGIDAALTPHNRDIARSISGPDILYIGEDDPLRIEISNSARRAVGIELIVDVNDLLDMPDRQTVNIEAGASAAVEIPLQPNRRGMGAIENIWFRWSGPIGLVRRAIVDEIGENISIVPNIRAVKTQAIRFADHTAYFGNKSEKRIGEGSEFESMRDYVAGLDHRWIDWKHSARHQRLVCKEFQTERNHQIILAFDAGHLMSEPIDGATRLDHAINAGLLAAYVSLKSGDQVGLYAFDSDIRLSLEPVGGLQQFGILQAKSGEIDYSNSETNFTLGLANLAERLTRRSLIILQTDFVDTTTAELMLENIARLTSRHLVLFVSIKNADMEELIQKRPDTTADVARSVVATEFQRDRQIVFERLRRLGVHCLEVPRERMGIGVVNSYLDIIQQELI